MTKTRKKNRAETAFCIWLALGPALAGCEEHFWGANDAVHVQAMDTNVLIVATSSHVRCFELKDDGQLGQQTCKPTSVLLDERVPFQDAWQMIAASARPDGEIRLFYSRYFIDIGPRSTSPPSILYRALNAHSWNIDIDATIVDAVFDVGGVSRAVWHAKDDDMTDFGTGIGTVFGNGDIEASGDSLLSPVPSYGRVAGHDESAGTVWTAFPGGIAEVGDTGSVVQTIASEVLSREDFAPVRLDDGRWVTLGTEACFFDPIAGGGKTCHKLVWDLGPDVRLEARYDSWRDSRGRYWVVLRGARGVETARYKRTNQGDVGLAIGIWDGDAKVHAHYTPIDSSD